MRIFEGVTYLDDDGDEVTIEEIKYEDGEIDRIFVDGGDCIHYTEYFVKPVPFKMEDLKFTFTQSLSGVRILDGKYRYTGMTCEFSNKVGGLIRINQTTHHEKHNQGECDLKVAFFLQTHLGFSNPMDGELMLKHLNEYIAGSSEEDELVVKINRKTKELNELKERLKQLKDK